MRGPFASGPRLAVAVLQRDQVTVKGKDEVSEVLRRLQAMQAQLALGRFYLVGVEEMGADPAEAERWLMMAADKGDKEAKKMLVQARKARNEAQADHKWRDDVRKNGWFGGWYSGYAYRSYWRDGRWWFY